MAYDTNTGRRTPSTRSDAPLTTGNPFWDVMLSLGKASSQALTAYTGAADAGVRPAAGQAVGTARRAADVEVIALGEETLNVGTRQVAGETTRVRRVVVETPVEREVVLREERVVVERRKPTAATTATATQGLLSETAVEMTDTYQVAEVWKSVHVVEEVVLRREVSERRETVRDTVRRDEVSIEHAPRALRAPRHEPETTRTERPAVAAPRAEMPNPEKLAADLQKVAERFETDAERPAASRPGSGAAQAERAQPAAQPRAEAPKAAEQPKAPARPEANDKNDKADQGRKG